MAGYKGHTFGAAFFVVMYVLVIALAPFSLFASSVGLLSNEQTLAGLMIVGMLFGLWPDIDTNSRGQDIFFAVAFITDIALIWAGRLEAAAYLGLLAMTPIVGKHRGWTHSRIAMILVPLPIVLIPYVYNHNNMTVAILFYGAAITGYFSHLFLDGLITKKFHIKSKKW
ncbi:MAG: metal-dependent hydrolase [bacterium]|nr:metal-dependent hydrolase [bacterium]